MKADKLYLGNVITMDDYKQRAKAVAVKDGLIQYVGSEEIARSLCNENTEIIDFGNSTIYPGFLEAHCHPLGAGYFLDSEAIADLKDLTHLKEYTERLADFIQAHPGKSIYSGQGFVERDEKPTAALLDAVCSDVPVIINTVDGHSMWMNSKAMEVFGIDRKSVEKYGEDLVRVDEKGNPTGYISETPAFAVRNMGLLDPKDEKRFLLNSQDFFFSKGYTAVYDAGLEMLEKNGVLPYQQVLEEGSLKLRTYAGSLIDEFCEDIPGAVEKIAEMQKQYNCEYFKIIGVKTFSDGVVEAHTAYLLDDYSDQPGYKGAARMTDHEKLVELFTAASEAGMSVHVHTIGDAAIHCNLDAIEEAVQKTGKMDQRFALAHLQIVKEEDFKRFGDLNVAAVVASLWAPKNPSYFQQEIDYVGKDRAERSYPVKSFFDAGAVTAFHTDYPVSQNVSIPNAVITAVLRRKADGTEENVREADEFITRYQALCAMTKNVAYMWHEENRMGSLETGKLANMTVFDKDFLADALEDVAEAKLVCTIVDGEIVYEGGLSPV